MVPVPEDERDHVEADEPEEGTDLRTRLESIEEQRHVEKREDDRGPEGHGLDGAKEI